MKIWRAFQVLAWLSTASCRLSSHSHDDGEGIAVEKQQLRGTAAEKTNEISFYLGDGHEVIDVFHAEWNESPETIGGNVTFDFLSRYSSGAIIHDDEDDTRQRDLQYGLATMKIEVFNQCHSAIHLALIYKTPTNTGVRLKGDGWHKVESGDSHLFKGITGRAFSLYAESTPGGAYKWEGDSGSEYCVNGKCFRDFQETGSHSKANHYLSCTPGNSGGNPTNAPPPPPPPEPAPQGRAGQWLSEHNERRARHNYQGGGPPVLLQWSSTLATSAQNYVSQLAALNGCVIKHGHNGDSHGGENLAADWGSSSSLRSVDSIMARWYDAEENLPWPESGHYSQVAWRASKWVGCGETSKSFNGGYCRIQACRYITPGNCNVASDGSNLDEMMAKSSTPCQPQVP